MDAPPAIEHRQPVDFNRLLSCIAQVEGHQSSSPGGIYAITKAVWEQHSQMPYYYASVRNFAVDVAKRHLRWLSFNLTKAGIDPSPYALAVCWRHGLEGGKKLLNNPKEGYGQRAANLYHEKK